MSSVVCVSHPWLQPDHPDPKGVNLRLLGRVLEKFLKSKAQPEDKLTLNYAVFLGIVGQERTHGLRPLSAPSPFDSPLSTPALFLPSTAR